MRSRARLAAEEIGICRKPLFYCSRWSFVVDRWPATLGYRHQNSVRFLCPLRALRFKI
jgi:hypothetical protein